MGLKVFNRVSRRYLEAVALIVVGGLLGGCSSDFTRFTDGIYTSSTSSRNSVVQRPMLRYQQIPPAVQEVTAYNTIESGELPLASTPNPEPVTQTASLGIGTPPPGFGALPVSEEKSAARMESPRQRGTYIVQSGDTLFGIAHRSDTSVDDLKRENRLSSDMIRIGQVLSIPGGDMQVANAAVPERVAVRVPIRTKTMASESALQAKVVETVTVKPVTQTEAATVPHPEKAVASAADATQEAKEVAAVAPQAAGISPSQMRWPARGRILSRYGQREGTITNDGMDIMVPEGTSVKAADDGVVIYADDGLKEFGNTVLIRHENNIVTVYGHNSKILVQRGQKVRRGDEIAKSGMSGNASTPRLHFEVRKNSAPVNPIKYLED